MTWPGFPKRLQSALKALCCLAQSGTAMQSSAIAGEIDVPKAETAKILQLLVWGGFVISRRGINGGFQLAMPPKKITMGEVIDFFLARQPEESTRNFPVLAALQLAVAPGQQKFSRLTLDQAANFGTPGAQKGGPARGNRPATTRVLNSSARKLGISQVQRRSRSNANR